MQISRSQTTLLVIATTLAMLCVVRMVQADLRMQNYLAEVIADIKD
jgi:hypothetical protein